jgi:hypothetical protein
LPKLQIDWGLGFKGRNRGFFNTSGKVGHKNGGSSSTPRIPTSKWAGEGVGDFEL